MHQKRIKKEQDRLKKLEEIDRQRREKYVELKQKKRDRIQIKKDLERERSRMKKCDDERQVNTHFNAFFENDKTAFVRNEWLIRSPRAGYAKSWSLCI